MSLRRQLSSRLRVVTIPITRRKQSNEKARLDEITFQQKSQHTQMAIIREKYAQEIKRAGYKTPPHPQGVFVYEIIGYRRCSDGFLVVAASFLPTFTKKVLSSWRYLHFRRGLYESVEQSITWNRVHRCDVFCCSLRPTPKTRVSEALPTFGYDSTLDAFSGSWEFGDLSITGVLHLIHCQSEHSFLALLKRRVESIE